MSCITPTEYRLLIQRTEVVNFCIRCLEKVGAKSDQGKELGEVLAEGDYRGHYSHGLNRLEMYVVDVEKRICEANGDPIVEKETVSTALVNGNNLLGPVVGNFAMNVAIKKAKETGISWISAYGSNHYGIAGYYALKAARQGLIGMSFTNTSPLVFPTRACKQALGTNPLAVAAPAGTPGEEFVLDMATSAVALGKLEMCRRRGLNIPDGWAADGTGNVTNDPAAAIDGGGLLPLGGDEMTSGYKGYGLSMMVEIFCGILANGAYGPNIRRWMDRSAVANLGQAFVAIDPNVFAPGFKDRMDDYMKTIRELPRTDANRPILIPGDPERNHMTECETEGGIRYPAVLIESLHKLADRLNVSQIQVIKTLP